jgi:hypothetical protein
VPTASLPLRTRLRRWLPKHGVRKPRCVAGLGAVVIALQAGVAGVYKRATYLPEKTAALTRWAEHVRAVVTGQGGKVVVRCGGCQHDRAPRRARAAATRSGSGIRTTLALARAPEPSGGCELWVCPAAPATPPRARPAGAVLRWPRLFSLAASRCVRGSALTPIASGVVRSADADFFGVRLPAPV